MPSVVDGIRSAELIVGVLGSPDRFSQHLASADNESHAVDAYLDKEALSFVNRTTKEF